MLFLLANVSEEEVDVDTQVQPDQNGDSILRNYASFSDFTTKIRNTLIVISKYPNGVMPM